MAKNRKSSTLRRALSGVLAVLSLCLAAVLSMTGCAKKITYTIEAGSDLKSEAKRS